MIQLACDDQHSELAAEFTNGQLTSWAISFASKFQQQEATEKEEEKKKFFLITRTIRLRHFAQRHAAVN
jgi:hypothetical protein